MHEVCEVDLFITAWILIPWFTGGSNWMKAKLSGTHPVNRIIQLQYWDVLGSLLCQVGDIMWCI